MNLTHKIVTTPPLPPSPRNRCSQTGAVLITGLVILGILLVLVTIGTRTLVTMERISANAQQRAVANYAAESVVIQAINDQNTITPLLDEARNRGQSVERTIAVVLPDPNQSGNADVAITTRPTIGFSADTLTTYNIAIGANATSQSTEGAVTQTFMRIGVAN